MWRLSKAAIVPALVLVLWQLSYWTNRLPPLYATSPEKVAEYLFSDRSQLALQLGASLKRLILGIAIGAPSGALTGALLARFTRVQALVSPTVRFVAPIPIVIWIPFAIMIFGLGESFKIALVALSTFFLVYFYTFNAVNSLDKRFFELASIYEKTLGYVALNIVLPGALPGIVSGIRLSVALGWIAVIVAEAADARAGAEGLGYYILNAGWYNKIESEFSGVLLLGLVAYLIDTILLRLQRATSTWGESLETWLGERVK
jgi:sulfonate transport system permease protein